MLPAHQDQDSVALQYGKLMWQPILYMLPDLIDAFALPLILRILVSTSEDAEEAVGMLLPVFQITVVSALAGISTLGIVLAECSGEEEELESHIEAGKSRDQDEKEIEADIKKTNITMNHASGMVAFYVAVLGSVIYNYENILPLFGFSGKNVKFIQAYMKPYLLALFPQLFLQSYYKLNATIKTKESRINNKVYNIIFNGVKCLLDVSFNYIAGVTLGLGPQYCALGSALAYWIMLIAARLYFHNLEDHKKFKLNNIFVFWEPFFSGTSYIEIFKIYAAFWKGSGLLFLRAFTFSFLNICSYTNNIIVASSINQNFSIAYRKAYTVVMSSVGIFFNTFCGLCVGQGILMSDLLGKLKVASENHIQDLVDLFKKMRMFFSFNFFIATSLVCLAFIPNFSTHFFTEHFIPEGDRPYQETSELLRWSAPITALNMLFVFLNITYLAAVEQYILPTILNFLLIAVTASSLTYTFAKDSGVEGVFAPQVACLATINALLIWAVASVFTANNVEASAQTKSELKVGGFLEAFSFFKGTVAGYDPIGRLPNPHVIALN